MIIKYDEIAENLYNNLVNGNINYVDSLIYLLNSFQLGYVLKILEVKYGCTPNHIFTERHQNTYIRRLSPDFINAEMFLEELKNDCNTY
jgi:hypothetical protein